MPKEGGTTLSLGRYAHHLPLPPLGSLPGRSPDFSLGMGFLRLPELTLVACLGGEGKASLGWNRNVSC